VRKTLVFAVLLAQVLTSPASADEETRQRLIHFFGGWYSWYPNSMMRVAGSREVEIAGFETYRVERSCESKFHREANVALVDRAKDEVFVGEVFHDLARRMAKRPFDPAADVPPIEGSLAEAYGLPVRVKLEAGARSTLKPILITIHHADNARVSIPGFVSDDGATLMIGEFHPLSSDAQAIRRKLLAESSGIRTEKGAFSVTEFIDFQCERCRVRAPEVKKAVTERGGAVEVRLLPLTKGHDWAFPAAEYAAALANVDPEMYAKYEEALFAREGMTAAAARQIASDVAEAAGTKERFEAELSSGRARERVVSDIRLAIRLGLSGTPSFLHEGNFVSGERELFEAYLREKLSPAVKPEAAPPSAKPGR
jgi:predicted DsbA family dithiol-disulfide isomerase